MLRYFCIIMALSNLQIKFNFSRRLSHLATRFFVIIIIVKDAFNMFFDAKNVVYYLLLALLFVRDMYAVRRHRVYISGCDGTFRFVPVHKSRTIGPSESFFKGPVKPRKAQECPGKGCVGPKAPRSTTRF